VNWKQFIYTVGVFVVASAVAANLQTLAGSTIVGKFLNGDLVRRA